MTAAKVTVLMPVYNAEKYLAEAIDSILNQTLTDFEFLIIDDGSIDNSVDIIHSYNDPRIRLVRNEKNLGISATLNKGIQLSTTELIARMDADDISYPTRLQQQFDYFKAHPNCALVSSWAQEVSEEKEPLFVEEFNSKYYEYILNFECWIYHPTVMYKRSAVLECGGYSEKYCEDYDLWWKISKKYDIANISEVLLDYRSSIASLSRVTNKLEYEEGHQKQIIRNVRYYTGKDFQLTPNEVEALRYNCEGLIATNNIFAIITFFKKLDYINQCLFRKDYNKNINALKEAAAFKRDILFKAFLEKLPINRKIQLLITIGGWKVFTEVTKGYILNLPNKIFNRTAAPISA